MGEDAIVGAPELVLIETSPHGIFFDVEDEVCFAFFELDDVGFADRRDRVSSRAHPGTIDLVPAVVKDKIADDGTSVGCIDMQFLSQCIQRDLDILDHRVAFGLFI